MKKVTTTAADAVGTDTPAATDAAGTDTTAATEAAVTDTTDGLPVLPLADGQAGSLPTEFSGYVESIDDHDFDLDAVIDERIAAAIADLTCKLPAMIDAVIATRDAGGAIDSDKANPAPPRDEEAVAAAAAARDQAAAAAKREAKAQARARQDKLDRFEDVATKAALAPLASASDIEDQHVEAFIVTGDEFYADWMVRNPALAADGVGRLLLSESLTLAGELPAAIATAIVLVVFDHPPVPADGTPPAIIAATGCAISPPLAFGGGQNVEFPANSLVFRTAD